MSWDIQLFGFLAMLLALLLSGMWVPFGIGIGAIAAIYFNFGTGAFGALGLVTWGTLNSYTLSAIPLFIFMAEMLSQSGISAGYYRSLSLLVRRLPGGLFQTNIAGCALFAAISGSSVATAAAIGSVAIPQLDERKYDSKMSCGSLAAGGTLGILIPPSLTMIIYGSITEVSVAKLFMAGVVPGIGLALLFMLYIGVRCLISPELAPREKGVIAMSGYVMAVLRLMPFLVLIGLVLGSIYAGIATPTEAAGLGCLLSALLCLGSGKLTLGVIHRSLLTTVKTSATLLFIVLAAFIFSYAIEIAGIGDALKEFVVQLQLTRLEFLVFLIVLYGLLGCIMDGAGMVVLTVPLFFPLLAQYNIDPVWYGIFLVMLVELGMLTPPFGLNLFIVKSISGRSLGTVVAGCVPYFFIMLFGVALMIAFPLIALWLPLNM